MPFTEETFRERARVRARKSEWRTAGLSIRQGKLSLFLVKILADADGFERASSANKRTVVNGFDGFPICNFPRRRK